MNRSQAIRSQLETALSRNKAGSMTALYDAVALASPAREDGQVGQESAHHRDQRWR